jgi:hypothetical protein
MLRKPPVLPIPDKPTGRTRPERSRVDAKHGPDTGPEQFDLWGAFAASFEHDQAVEAAHRAGPRLVGVGANRQPAS